MDITHITSLLGGIALFLYGMSIMGAGLEKLAGGKMQGVLQKLTSSTIKGVIFGTLITGVIQSSAGTVVICVGLVNSGIMTLTQSVGVIMGANIGTTVTGQLIRMADISGDSLWLTLMQPKTFAPVVAFIGCIFYVFLRNAKKKNIGQIMLGFGILFTGMNLMDTGVSPLRESAAFQDLFVSMTNPILGVLVGVVVTVIIQSSSASVGILQSQLVTGLGQRLGGHIGVGDAVDAGGHSQNAVAVLRDGLLGKALCAELCFLLRVDALQELLGGLGGFKLFHKVLVHQHLHHAGQHINVQTAVFRCSNGKQQVGGAVILSVVLHRGAQPQSGQTGAGDHIGLGVGHGDSVVHIGRALGLAGIECLFVGLLVGDVAHVALCFQIND